MIRLQTKHMLPALLLSLSPLIHAEDWPAPIAATVERGVEIVGQFDAPSGLKGYAGKFNGQGMALFLTEDQQHVIVGTMLDATGTDVSRAALDKLVYGPMGEEMWAQLEASDWIGDGADDAGRVVYTFTDPNCPFCSMFWKQARPWVESGKVQLRHIMVGILREDSPGKSAAILVAKDPAAALHEHEAGDEVKALDTIPAAIAQQLKTNHDLMAQLGAQATPAIFYLDDKGNMQQQQGAPRPDRLAEIMGPE
ncbi:thiol:disulfide interchange protein DsbG [Halopseudomonas pelagia]|uniref:Thiol:disulfide interchange protein n=1 Tax=Halopseudomonas pelagia TaxID=553151 RepID=A0AA91U394_9GAMM|nr:thiol:disulfide interchange protein DsbG [Halopseudomonas pelagia]PCC99939.1 thiol:disulfide interchange protein DsbG [Halopseudomonas pelagia]QFY56199.1 thiol:disulfide interchange protein DsbG [Halopseudomonas pelagia]